LCKPFKISCELAKNFRKVDFAGDKPYKTIVKVVEKTPQTGFKLREAVKKSCKAADKICKAAKKWVEAA
jgi:hypothetical protein